MLPVVVTLSNDSSMIGLTLSKSDQVLPCVSSCPQECLLRMGHGHGFCGLFCMLFMRVNSLGCALAQTEHGGCPAVLVSQRGTNSAQTMCCLHKGFFVDGERGQLSPPASS